MGYPPGGAPDAYFRVLARHYGRHIPGHPAVVAKNMQGAGGLRAANYLYNAAPKNGTELANFGPSAAMEPLLGNDQAKFDPAKFSWIGSITQEISFCGVWQRPGAATSFEEMMTRETLFGGSGPSSVGHQHAILLNLIGARVTVVNGYRGVPDAYLAMQRGETGGTCPLARALIRALAAEDFKSGRLKLVIQMGPKRTSELGDIPSVFDYAKTDEVRQVLEFHFNQRLLGRPLVGPPGVPKARLDALRKAFQATMKDPEFLADAERTNLDVDPATGEQAEQLLAQISNYPKAVIEKAKAAIGR
jgi:tripartite-type tricarboxylate transporter receptor subunit TctC